MERIFRDERRVAWAGHLQRPFEFVSPCGGGEFSMLLWVADSSITVVERWTLSVAFVRQGCRYAVCAGHGCSSWDDSIDYAYLESDPQYSTPDETFVMTSWHEAEPIEDIASFLVMCTSFDDYEAKAFVVVCLGGDAEVYGQVRDAVSRRLRLPSG